MTFLDKLKESATQLKETAQQAVHDHGDQIRSGLDKAGEQVNKATKGKYADRIEKGLGAAKSGVGKFGARAAERDGESPAKSALPPESTPDVTTPPTGGPVSTPPPTDLPPTGPQPDEVPPAEGPSLP
ncbi:MAG TPA: antitoxin [Nocardioidaceae bacterium]|nr:antitoxin [Nocardioidaceae bacterium]